MNNDLTHDLTSAYAQIKAAAFHVDTPTEDQERAILLENIGKRMHNDWIEHVASWAVFAILCAVILVLLAGCAGAYIPKCEHVEVAKDKFAVTNTPCTRKIQYQIWSEKIKAVCVADMENKVHCQEVAK